MIDLAAGVPICGFTGINGAGKTLLAVESAIADMSKGRTVYSTVPIWSEHGESVPIRSLRQLLEVEDCTILLDDISVIFSARLTQSLPAEVVVLLHTLRHRKVTVRWTAPEWMRADTNIRGVTQGLVSVTPMLRKRIKDDPWPVPRVVLAGLLDTSTGKADSAPTRVMRRRILIPTKLAAFGSYDTHADTPMLGAHAVTVGVCPDCGGSRTRPKHSEERHRELGLPWYEDRGMVGALPDEEDSATVAFAESTSGGV